MKILRDSKGLSMVECVISMFLVTIAIVSIMAMQPLAWQGAGKSDYMGRAAGILQRELEWREYKIMVATITSTEANGVTYADKNGNIVDSASADKLFKITAATAAGSISNTYLLHVKIEWLKTANNFRGLSSSVLVSLVPSVYGTES